MDRLGDSTSHSLTYSLSLIIYHIPVTTQAKSWLNQGSPCLAANESVECVPTTSVTISNNICAYMVPSHKILIHFPIILNMSLLILTPLDFYMRYFKKNRMLISTHTPGMYLSVKNTGRRLWLVQSNQIRWPNHHDTTSSRPGQSVMKRIEIFIRAVLM